jgi:DNA-binding XRE family transcriptional regulator
MSDSDAMAGELLPLTAREAALAYIADRRRQDPNWDYRTDPTYNGPFPPFIQMMSDAEFERDMARREEERRRSLGDPHPVEQQVVKDEPVPLPRLPVRAALPFGQRIRELRSALGWTQRDVAGQIGVSARTVIRYEQGRSSPIQAAPLLALRRLESAHAQELDTSSRKTASTLRSVLVNGSQNRLGSSLGRS